MLRSWGLAPTLTRALAAPSCGVLATPSVPSTCTTVPVRQLNANRCVVTKVKRAQYSRQFPTMAALPDGSTITIKYAAPVQLIRFPIDLAGAGEEARRRVHLLRRPRQALVVREDSGGTFDPMKYVTL